MSKRDDLIRLHKTAVEARTDYIEYSFVHNHEQNIHVQKYNAWRDAENAFMRVAEKVTNE